MTECCLHNDCNEPALGVIGIAFYPPQSVMHFYRTEQELTRMVTSIKCCQKHFDEFDIYENLLNQPTPKGNSTMLETMSTVFEHTSHTKVDRQGCKKVLVPFDDEHYKVLQKSGSK